MCSHHKSRGENETPWSPGTLKLVPPKGRIPELKADYESMRPMLFGSYPGIEEIVAYMAVLEAQINGWD